jgi:PAT family beta-lactamase induction signal transducer AmpG
MRIALPDLLATRKGRLTAFFLLYVTEGIPLGFTRRRSPRRCGAAARAGGDRRLCRLALPAGRSWAVGPFVDTFSSERFGRRRTDLLMKLGMMATLLVAMGVDFVGQSPSSRQIIFA